MGPVLPLWASKMVNNNLPGLSASFHNLCHVSLVGWNGTLISCKIVPQVYAYLFCLLLSVLFRLLRLRHAWFELFVHLDLREIRD